MERFCNRGPCVLSEKTSPQSWIAPQTQSINKPVQIMKELNNAFELPANTVEIDHFLKYHSLFYPFLTFKRQYY